MANYRHIEDSFKLIRVKTNISDVREIVQKFMSKEQTYASLLTAVAQNEQKFRAQLEDSLVEIAKLRDTATLDNQEKMKQVQLELERAYLDAGRLDAENVPHSRVEICPLHVSWKLS